MRHQIFRHLNLGISTLKFWCGSSVPWVSKLAVGDYAIYRASFLFLLCTLFRQAGFSPKVRPSCFCGAFGAGATSSSMRTKQITSTPNIPPIQPIANADFLAKPDPADTLNLIRARAFGLYEERGPEDGHAEEDWLRVCPICSLASSQNHGGGS
jgi:hypothetical protein